MVGLTMPRVNPMQHEPFVTFVVFVTFVLIEPAASG
jgi:hypothetical protein